MNEHELINNEPSFLNHSVGLGVLSVSEVIEWCDRIIKDTDKPDILYLELSMSPKSIHEIQKHLIKMGASDELTDDMCLVIIAGGYFNNSIDFKKALYYLYQQFCIDWNDMSVAKIYGKIQ